MWYKIGQNLHLYYTEICKLWWKSSSHRIQIFGLVKSPSWNLKKEVKKSRAKDKQPGTDWALEKNLAVGFSGMKLDTKVISYLRVLKWESTGLSSLEDNMPKHSPNDW